nr:odorant receptor 4-like [Aedes albopictus]
MRHVNYLIQQQCMNSAGLTYVKFESSRRYFSRLFKIWISTCVLGTLHWAIFPILQREKVLPLQCWYPIDVHRSPLYELAFLGQVLGQLQVGLVYGMTGALLMMYIFINSLSVMKLMNIEEYFVLTMAELFSFCYLGETLKNQSVKISNALLSSTWYKCGAQFRQRVMLILKASQKPLKLSALKLYHLDFETYRSVLTAAFSYYTILKKLQGGSRHAN